MPYFGLLSFLHFTIGNGTIINKMVSMPYFGLLSFLPPAKFSHNRTMNSFNALLRASFFSTNSKRRLLMRMVTSFNALLRASFFSTNGRNIKFRCWISVSMPYFGLLSFLRYASAAIDFTGFSASSL